MTEPGPGRPDAPGRRRPGPGYLLVLVASVVAGVVGILPFVVGAYAVQQLVLVPLGLAPLDPTNNDGTAVLVVTGVLAPLAVVLGWAVVVALLVRDRHLRRVPTWAMAAVVLVAPTLVFVVGRLG